jgi:hypothetical protein
MHTDVRPYYYNDRQYSYCWRPSEDGRFGYVSLISAILQFFLCYLCSRNADRMKQLLGSVGGAAAVQGIEMGVVGGAGNGVSHGADGEVTFHPGGGYVGSGLAKRPARDRGDGGQRPSETMAPCARVARTNSSMALLSCSLRTHARASPTAPLS